MKSGKCENNEYWERQNLPYERFAIYGGETLTDQELLAIVLRSGTKNVGVRELSARVLDQAARYGNGLLGLYHVPVRELQKIEGIGAVKAVQLKAIAEFARRMAMEKARGGLSFHDPATVANFYMEKFRHKEVEHILLLSLDSGLRLIGEETLSKGTVNASLLSPREVFIQAFRNEAAYIMLLHNHPGGSPVPSKNDLLATDRIGRAGALADVPLLDHIIIGDNSYFSFNESKLLAGIANFEEASIANQSDDIVLQSKKRKG